MTIIPTGTPVGQITPCVGKSTAVEAPQNSLLLGLRSFIDPLQVVANAARARSHPYVVAVVASGGFRPLTPLYMSHTPLSM